MCVLEQNYHFLTPISRKDNDDKMYKEDIVLLQKCLQELMLE